MKLTAYTIAKNTFTETLRQPIYSVILLISLLLFTLSPSVAMNALGDKTKLLRELGLSTLFLTGLFIAIFSATGAITEEIETKTITTVLSKPVSRWSFVIGKFLGISSAVGVAHYICSVAMIMGVRHGVLEDVSDVPDWPVVVAAIVAVVGTLLLTSFLNYSYDWPFLSTAIVILAVFATIAMGFLALISSEWQFDPANNSFESFDIYGSILLFFGVMVLVSLAVMFSTRFNVIITLSCCIGIFLLGLISDFAFGKFADTHIWAKIGVVAIPNLQVFWITDAIHNESMVPASYLGIGAAYAGLYTAGILCLAVAMFQKRQVG